MINHLELVKELHRFGFNVQFWEEDGGQSGLAFSSESGHVPTLDEMIEACGDGFHSLTNMDGNKWVCVGHVDPKHPHSGTSWRSMEADSPAEAVAKLCIALMGKANG